MTTTLEILTAAIAAGRSGITQTIDLPMIDADSLHELAYAAWERASGFVYPTIDVKWNEATRQYTVVGWAGPVIDWRLVVKISQK